MYRTLFLSKDLDKVGYYKKYSNTLNIHYNGKTYTDKHDIVTQVNEYFYKYWSKFGIYNSLKYET